VFELIRHHTLVAKPSKCNFGTTKVEYLGHFLSVNGISAYPKKVKALMDWPIPNNIKELRSFLGLEGYYRKFIQKYAILVKPLTQLTEEATEAMNRLNLALTSAPVLGFPEFSKTFIVETDASSFRIGVVLRQGKQPLTFLSRTLGPR